jgi:hypothetical protein
MRHAKTIFQFGVMWVLVFVMAAGPLPLGIPRAEAQPVVTDVPGIKNFYTPRLFIVFDTSKSMVYLPADPNGDPSFQNQDWDPNVPTAPADCVNKRCLGKRAVYQALPKYTSRIEMGLAGYNEYYQLTTEPANYYTACYYDKIAYSSGAWGSYFYASTLADLTGTGTDPLATKLQPASVEIAYTDGVETTVPHRTRKWTIATGLSGSLQRINVTGAGYGPTDTVTVGTYTYDWVQRIRVPGITSFTQASLGGSCPATIPNYSGGACLANGPCDLYAETPPTHTEAFPPFYSGTDLGPTVVSGTNTYTRSGPTTNTFYDDCGLSGTYTGAGASCASVSGGCTITQTGGPFNTPYGSTVTYYSNAVSPGPPTSWELVSTTTSSTDVQLTVAGATCPALGTVITDSSGPLEWRSLATGGSGPGTGSNDCSTDPRYTCTWTMVLDYTVNLEQPQHFCRFTRPEYNWRQYSQQCSYQTQIWTYSTSGGETYCDYKHYEDDFSHPIYTYSYLPNDGDIVGYGGITWNGNDNLNGQPNAYAYSGGQFANGYCPNLIMNSAVHPECSNGVLCKLSWQSDTTIGATNFPNGRYSNSPWGGWPWSVAPPGLAPVADPIATLTDPLYPPNPMGYATDWLRGGGHGDNYYVHLMANIYYPPDPNPPSDPTFGDPLFSCSTCTYQYSYKPPPTKDAAGFAAVATTMPPNRDSGLGILPDGRAAISFSPLALNNALLGGTPSADGPLLKMLSKYDPVTNPTGLQQPDFGDYTPLTGSLANVKDYLQTVIDADAYAGCGRRYYVMLMTDGEEQPAGLSTNNPVGAVTALRNMTTSTGLPVDVKTFVIGFGLLAPSPQLDSMARAGGTSVSAADLVTPDLSPSGVAFDGSTPARLLTSLEAAFGQILEGYFTRSKPAINVAGTEMYVGYFRLLFNGLEWQGKLDAIDIETKPVPTLADTVTDSNYNYLWRYGDAANTTLPSSSINKQTSRTVYTSLSPNTGNRIFFDYATCPSCASSSGWNTNSGADQTALELAIATLPSDAQATIALLLNKGVPTNPEKFSNGIEKKSRASDIFHSDPAIVEGAAQSANWPDGTESAAYTGFRTSAAILNREKTVYIGANDGMLHAVRDLVTSPGAVVDPLAGMERWAYVPNQILPNLAQMRDQHTYGVDGSLGIADVCGTGFSGSPCTAPDGWRTLLVGALGRGGTGLYALDITDPTDPKPKWERSASTDVVLSRTQVPRFGYTWGAPVIARTNVSGLGKVWSVFVGAGQAGQDPMLVAWGNRFFVLDARTGQPLFDGTTYADFSIPDDPADPAPNNVASRPTLYRPADGALVDRVFFNDTEGKIWKMNAGGLSIATWNPAPTANITDAFFDPASSSAACQLDVNGNPTPILDATTGAPILVGFTPMTLPLTVPRPKIFNRPMLALDQTSTLNVYVGTGDTDHPNDTGTFDYFYGLSDIGPTCAQPLFVLRFAPDEKMLADPAFLNNVIFATTYLPPPAGNCVDAGRGFLYAWDARTGQPTAAIKDPVTGLMVAKLDLGANTQLKQSGIPSAPIIRNGKLYVAFEADPAHPRIVDLGSMPTNVKVKGWQRVK